MSGDPAPTSNVTSAAPIGPIDGILAVQEVSTATDERSRGIKRGHDLLDRLDDIRYGLLTGSIPRERLLALRDAVATRRLVASDPRLGAILDEIDLRASVELAKLGIT